MGGSMSLLESDSAKPSIWRHGIPRGTSRGPACVRAANDSKAYTQQIPSFCMHVYA